MAINKATLAAARKYTKETILGGGAIVGKNVQVAKIEPIIGGNRVTFSYTLDDGTNKISEMEVMNGEKGTSIINASIQDDNVLTLKLSDGQVITAGKITVDSSQLKLDNYYTIEQTKDKFIQKLDLNTLIQNYLDTSFVVIESDEIKKLFI